MTNPLSTSHTPPRPFVSVLVPVYQGARWLARCLDALAAQDYPEDLREIVVVDDGSTDGSEAVASGREGVRVVVIDHAGRPAALNRGLAEARGQIVLFTDADCAPSADWARTLVGLLLARPDLAGVGGNQLPARITAVAASQLLAYLHEFQREFVIEGTYTRFCLNGNNMALRADRVRAAGGFDESYLHGADADLTRRMLAAGDRLLRTPDSCVVHLKQDDLRSLLATAWHRGSTVRFAMDAGALGPAGLVRALAAVGVRFVEDVRAAFRLRAIGRPVAAPARIAAPLVGLAARLVNWAGQVSYYRRFKRESAVRRV